MLITVAAKRWGVPPADCYASEGMVFQKGGPSKFPFGQLAEEAAKLPVPETPSLKHASDFKLLQKPLPRLDSPAKLNGSAVFAIDVKLPGMLVAAVRTSPAFGGEVSNLAELKKQMPKGVQLVAIPGGVAAVARGYWVAHQALRGLKIRFKGSPHLGLDSKQISETLRKSTESKGLLAHAQGDVSQKFSENEKRISAFYEVPYLAHATMEPMTAVASVKGDHCEVWVGSQSGLSHKKMLARLLKIPEKNIDIHVVFLGCGFGRRDEDDFVSQAALISRAVKRPVKVIWSREEDIQHDFYRPAFAAKMEAVLDRKGKPLAWKAANAGSSIIARRLPQMLEKMGGIDFASVDGFKLIPYAIPNQEITTNPVPMTVPIGFWRSVGQSHNVFFVESFIDELAHAAGQDPVEYRRALLKDQPRHLAVLEMAAKKSGWNESLPPGHGRGIALAEAVETITVQVAEVSVEKNGRLTVHRVTCVYDCGPIVNPQAIDAQLQGGIVFGLGAALRGEITIQNGQVQQSNFDDYRVLTLPETPQIEVHRVASEGKMGGMGEASPPGIAPAVANAVFAATGRRIRKLPIEKALAALY